MMFVFGCMSALGVLAQASTTEQSELIGIPVDVWSAIGTVGSAALAAIVVWFTRSTVKANEKMVKEMEASRKAQTDPQILASFVSQSGYIFLNIVNVGGAAANVVFEFTPRLMNHRNNLVELCGVLHRPLPLMLPGQEVRVEFDHFREFFDLDYYLGKRIVRFDMVVKASDVASSQPFAPSRVALDLRPLSPHGHTEGPVLRARQLRPGGWRWLEEEPTPEEQGQFELLIQELRQQGVLAVDPKKKPRHNENPEGTMAIQAEEEIAAHGWTWVPTSGFGPGPAAVAIRNRGSHEGRVLYAEGWSDYSALVIALHRMVELEREWG